MRRSTVVVVAGERADEIVSGLDPLPNVRAIGGDDPYEVAGVVSRATTTYVVHDADPLGAVGAAWADLFDGVGATGRLEVEIEAAITALRSERLVLPDYYVVLDPDDLPVTRRHWWLGVLAGAAPARVVPAPASVSAVTGVLGRLASGRWWPSDTEGWLRALPRTVPDRAGLPTTRPADGPH